MLKNIKKGFLVYNIILNNLNKLKSDTLKNVDYSEY